jgi:hypothetical protein
MARSAGAHRLDGTLCCTCRCDLGRWPSSPWWKSRIAMFTRRELLTSGTTLLLLVPVLGCSSSSSNAADGGSCAGIDSTSTVNASHSHTVCVLTTDLTSPPVAGVTYTTSSEGSHTHKVVLTAANLTAISGGQTVMVTSSTDNDPINNMPHSHDFMIKKM